MRPLKLDPRPVHYDSLAERLSDEDISATVDPFVETRDWAPRDGRAPSKPLAVAFVDGVQRADRRITAEGEGLPTHGLLASYAAGAVLPGDTPAYRHTLVRRDVILASGRLAPIIPVQALNTCLEYLPANAESDDDASLQAALNERRSRLELEVVRRVQDEGVLDLLVVDGRLPLSAKGAVGLIKTLHHVYVAEPDHVGVLHALKPGQRTPIFAIQRQRSVFSWFVSLADPVPGAIAFSTLARLEMDMSEDFADVLRTADRTAALLPRYASRPERDGRAPQNLLPIGQLERELRHQLGDLELLQRFITKAFETERPEWQN